MRLTDIPSKFPIPFAADAGGGYIRAIPTASQIGITDGAASLHDGFPPLTFLPIESGGKAPAGKDMNGILFEISAWSQWQQAGGPIYYDADFATAIGGYPSGAVIMSSVTAGLLWYSTADNNATNPDSGGAANWTSLLPVPATISDLITGTDTVKYVNSATLALLRATTSQILAGADAARYMTPAAFYGARAAGSDVLAGTDDHKYLTSLALANATLGDGETTILPGGLLLKIVDVVLGTGASVVNTAFTFATPFPSSALFMGGQPNMGSSGTRSAMTLNFLSRTRFGATIAADSTSSSNPITNVNTVQVLALGR